MERSASVILDDLCVLAAVVLCSKSMSGMARVLKFSLFVCFFWGGSLLFFCLIELLLF